MLTVPKFPRFWKKKEVEAAEGVLALMYFVAGIIGVEDKIMMSAGYTMAFSIHIVHAIKKKSVTSDHRPEVETEED